MARQIEWICDGCDDRKTTLLSDRPANWRSIKVTLDGLADLTEGKEMGPYDLCQFCAAQLRSNSNPRNWNRYKAAVTDAELKEAIGQPVEPPSDKPYGQVLDEMDHEAKSAPL